MLNTDYNLNQDRAGGDHGRCNQNAASGARVLGGVLRLVGKVCCKDCRKQKSKNSQTALQVASMLRSGAGCGAVQLKMLMELLTDIIDVVEGDRQAICG
jgi:hypothetical protein